MLEDQSQVLSGTAQDHVDGITLSTFEIIAVHQAIVFHVSDDRFDGIASFKLAPDAASYTALLPCFEYFNIGNIVTAITKVHKTTLGTKAC